MLHLRPYSLIAVLLGAACADEPTKPPATAMPIRTAASAALLDDNRGNVGLALLESGLFTTAVSTLGLPVNPITLVPVPVNLTGRVLAHPKIHNLYWDDDWNAHNPDAPTHEHIDAFTRALVGSQYFAPAAQYGVGQATFTGFDGSSVFCGPRSPGAQVEFVEIIIWATCEIGFNPLSPIPGLFPAITGVPQADDDALYVIYLPRAATIVEGGCSFSGYHFFGAVPKVRLVLGVPVVFPQTFAFAVVQTSCLTPSGPGASLQDSVTRIASHEIIEAATDPLVGLGWIDDAVVTQGDLSDLFQLLSNVALDLRVGEAADICQAVHVTAPVPLAVTEPSLNNRILVAPYWSNQNNACVPLVPQTTLTIGSPHFSGVATFVTSATRFDASATDGGSGAGITSISYRVFPQGSTPPAYTTVPGATVQFTVGGPDGVYEVDVFATGNNGTSESPQAHLVDLDNTAPVIRITQPAATQYAHSTVLTLQYDVGDGAGSGVASFTPTMDGAGTLSGHGLLSGQVITLLAELALGPHTFMIRAVDHVDNAAVAAVTFTIIVTAQSIQDDVAQFLAQGMIKNAGVASSLSSKLRAAAALRATGHCAAAANVYVAFINELQAQSGKGVDAAAAAIMIADAQYLIAHCP